MPSPPRVPAQPGRPAPPGKVMAFILASIPAPSDPSPLLRPWGRALRCLRYGAPLGLVNDPGHVLLFVSCGWFAVVLISVASASWAVACGEWQFLPLGLFWGQSAHARVWSSPVRVGLWPLRSDWRLQFAGSWLPRVVNEWLHCMNAQSMPRA